MENRIGAKIIVMLIAFIGCVVCAATKTSNSISYTLRGELPKVDARIVELGGHEYVIVSGVAGYPDGGMSVKVIHHAGCKCLNSNKENVVK